MLHLVVFAAGMSSSRMHRPALFPVRHSAALHPPRAAPVLASAADKGEERVSAAGEGEALSRQVAVKVEQARAVEQALYLDVWQSATANSSDTGHFQAKVLALPSFPCSSGGPRSWSLPCVALGRCTTSLFHGTSP